VSVESLIRRISAAPRAAAVSTQVLRNLEGLPASRALHLESCAYGLLQGSAEHIAWLNDRAPAANCGPPGRLVVERCDSALHITLDRPLARNAIDRVLRDELVDALTLAALDAEISAVKLRAVGAAFCIGGDLAEFGTTRDPASAHLIRNRTSPALLLSGLAEILAVHVQGACVGAGLEIAAFARRVTATSDAWFQLPELAMGLLPGAGGCFSVPRRIGRQRSALMLLSGRRITAATALRWGLIDAIDDDLKLVG
jgi:enoyl-CoA hydratase/carnithine racemase